MLKSLLKPVKLVLLSVAGSIKTALSGMPSFGRLQKSSSEGNTDSFASLLKRELLDKINIDEAHIDEILSAGKRKPSSPLFKKQKFKAILIANRGEIAVRIIRACKELGIKAYIVYTTHDKDSMAVKYADKAYCIGKAGIAYLDIKKIIAIAKKAKAEAIHPGYGFLSENPSFVKLCEQNKIKFIGPPSHLIHLFGDKVKARELLSKAGIPIIGGTRRILIDANDAIQVAEKLGYPVILKASSGGGGKGVRIVNNQSEMLKAYESAQHEAEASFGEKGLYIEKYVIDPRHIEFQILADRYGNVIHVGERECSIQRRYQKLIEEAPSVALTPELREKMGAIAVKIARMIKYEGAGTVEFLLDKNNNFYFIEMNKRIQVEHGITEMITGVDLVKEQIKIAYGAKLALKQEDIKFTGHAIECRINAECPREGFCPSVGTITKYLPPGGPGIRVCSSSHAGQIVSPQYDSLIAKLMCQGKTRRESIARMRRALDEYLIEGIDTTVDFYKKIFREKDFVKGNIDTHYLEKHNIIESLGKAKKSQSEPTKQEKMLIITTAVSKYLESKGTLQNNKVNPWIMAGRQEVMNESS